MTAPNPAAYPRYAAGMTSGVLELRERNGRHKHYLAERPVNGGDILEVCFSGGWLPMRYEWGGTHEPPQFHFSVELGSGKVWQSFIELPDAALLRWPLH
jgi:hypothetical protein